MQGAWYYYDDGFTEQLLPVPPATSVTPPESGENRLCTKGTTAALSDAGFANVWGAGIGLWLNQVNHRTTSRSTTRSGSSLECQSVFASC